ICWLDVDISSIKYEDKIAVQCLLVDSTESRLAHQKILSISNRLAKVEETERHQLADILHDSVGENLTALSIALNVIKTQLNTHPVEELQERINDCLELVRQTGERTRSLMYDLHPVGLEEDGVLGALQIYCAHIAYRSNIKITIQPEELIFRFPETIEIALFRIAQEALNNVVKHAHARQVLINFRVEAEKIYMLVKDDGDGFDTDLLKKLAKQSHWGILSMQERAESAGGLLKVESKVGCGTSIIVEVPF
ncbi:MAG: sensor histidine kinase, partial [Anaerolineae bacterium]|nr:sensor histidine kinase [Anaerolineae bacterium]